MRNTRILAGILSASLCLGVCNPVMADCNIRKADLVTDFEYDSNQEQSCNEMVQNDVKNDDINFENVGYAKSGNLKYDDISDSLSIVDKTMTLEIGQVKRINFTEPVSRISWISQNPEKVQVDVNGYVTAVSKGNSKIYAWYNGKKYTVKVQVKGNRDFGSLTKIEYSAQVGKRVKLPKLNKVKVRYIKLISDNPEILSVENDGKRLKACSEGIADVRYSYEFKDKSGLHQGTGRARYTVIDPKAFEQSVGICEGESRKLKTSDLYGCGCKWKSSNKKVASVDELGVVTGISRGTAKISCKVLGKKLTYEVKVDGASDLHNHSGENDSYSELTQSRFVKLHFYQCGKYTVEQLDDYKDIDSREEYKNRKSSENRVPSKNGVPSGNEAPSKNEIPSGNELPSDNDNASGDLPKSDDKSPSKKDSIPDKKENPSNPTTPSENSNKKEIDPAKVYEDNNFRFMYVKSDKGYFIKLVGLTENGKKEKVIVVPETINGYPVRDISDDTFAENSASSIIFDGQVEKEIEIPGAIKDSDGVYKVLHKYTVIHELEKLDGTYEILKTESGNAIAGDVVVVKPRDFRGFIMPKTKHITVKSDDSSEIVYQYNRKIFSVSLNKGRGIKAVSGNGIYKYGQKILISAEASNGYTFNGWSGEEGIIDNEKLETLLTVSDKNITMTAYAVPITYIINMDVHDDKNTVLKKSYTTESANIVLDEPIRQGYDFTGWTGDCGTEPQKKVTVSSGSYGEKNYIANWKARNDTPYKVYHEKEMLEAGKYETSIEQLKGTTDSVVTPRVNNYDGYTKPEVQKVKIKADGKSSVTYRYERKKYSLKVVYGNGFLEKNSNRLYRFGEKISVAGKLKSGYTNYVIKDNKNNVIKIPETMPAKDIEVYAFAIPIKYSIAYDLNGGNQNPANPQNYTVETENFAIKSPTRNGYTFAGWTGSGIIKPEQIVEFKKGVTQGNKSYKANWIPNTYKFVFDSKGGTPVTPKQLPYGIKFGDLPIPSRPEYTFMGWYGPGKVKIDKNTMVPASNQTYTAEWKAINHDVILDANGGKFANGSSTFKVSGPYNSCLDMPIPTRSGYKFIKWESNGVGKVEGRKYRFDRKEGKLKAIWGDYHAAVNDYVVGKTYFQNEPNLKKWNVTGFICIKDNYELDGQKGFLFMADAGDNIIAVRSEEIARYNSNAENSNLYSERGPYRPSKYMNNVFYNALSEDLKSKICAGVYNKENIKNTYIKNKVKIKENISVLSEYEIDALIRQIRKRNIEEHFPKKAKEREQYIRAGQKVIFRSLWKDENSADDETIKYVNLRVWKRGIMSKVKEREGYFENRSGYIPVFFIAKN